MADTVASRNFKYRCYEAAEVLQESEVSEAVAVGDVFMDAIASFDGDEQYLEEFAEAVVEGVEEAATYLRKTLFLGVTE